MIGRLVNGAAAVAGSAGLSQLPAFLVQYRQHLAGRLEQARADLARVFAAAREQGLTPAEYLTRAAAEGGSFSRTVVEDARETLAAFERLLEAYEALSLASPSARPLAFVEHAEPELVEAVLANFTPTVPLSQEGLIYAAVGLFAGVLLVALCEGGLRVLVRVCRGTVRQQGSS